MAKVAMSCVWKMRNMITRGYTVKEIAEILKVNEATIRNYTKDERKRVNLKKEVI